MQNLKDGGELLNSDTLFRYLIKLFLYLTVLTPLIIWGGFVFPFVSARTIFFRLCIEIALAIFLLALASGKISFGEQKDIKEKIKKNYIFLALLLFLLSNLISAFFGFSFYNSFFSIIERSWGVFTLIHFFIFYFLIRLFFLKKDWFLYFNSFIGVSVIVSIIGIFQYFYGLFGIGAGVRISSVLGNPAYLSGYLLFSIFFVAYFLIDFRKNNYVINIFYFATILINLYAFFLTQIRGSYLGFFTGLFFGGLLYLFLGHKRKYKLAIVVVFVAVISLFSFIFIAKDNNFINKNLVLKRIFNISFSDSTAVTRLIGWKAAMNGFLDNPILGSGPENFNVVFNKYITADYYTYAPTEPYFDRAHNSFLDNLATGGIVGIVTYLALFFSIVLTMFKNYKEEKINLRECLLLVSLLCAYIIHLLFVFDDINLFLAFITFAGFVEFLNNDVLFSLRFDQDLSYNKDYFKKIFFISCVFIILLVGYGFNIKVLKADFLVSKGLSAQDNFTAISFFQEAFDLKVNPSRDILFFYANLISELTKQYEAFSKDENKKKIYDVYVKNLEKMFNLEIERMPYDALLYARFGRLYNLEFIIARDFRYADKAIFNTEKAISLSPNRPQYYQFLSDIYSAVGDNKKAVSLARQALEMNKNYSASWFYLSRALLFSSQLDDSFEYLKLSIEKGYIPVKQNFLVLAAQYLENKNIDKVIEIYELFLQQEPNDSDISAKLTILYLRKGENKKAIEWARRSAEINPNLKKDSDYIIKNIQEGKVDDILKQINIMK